MAELSFRFQVVRREIRRASTYPRDLIAVNTGQLKSERNRNQDHIDPRHLGNRDEPDRDNGGTWIKINRGGSDPNNPIDGIVKLTKSSSSDPQDTGLQSVANPPYWAPKAAVSLNLTIPPFAPTWPGHRSRARAIARSTRGCGFSTGSACPGRGCCG